MAAVIDKKPDAIKRMEAFKKWLELRDKKKAKQENKEDS